MKVHTGLRSHTCSTCNRGFYWAHSLRAHMTSHSREDEKQTVPASDISYMEMNNTSFPEIVSEQLLVKAVPEDSFTILTTKDLNGLGLETFQIFAISDINEGVETFSLYSSECNNDQLSLKKNSSISLSAISL